VATRFIVRLRASMLPLLAHPFMGPSRSRLSAGLRLAVFRRYAVYYLPGDTEVLIVRVLHGHRDVDAITFEP
jgi:toxin ParE1/3/4